MNKLVARGVTYDVTPKGYIYLNGKRVSKGALFAEMELEIKESQRETYNNDNEVLERAEQRTLNKGNKMEYLLVIIFAVAVVAVALHAYKPEWFDPIKQLINKQKLSRSSKKK